MSELKILKTESGQQVVDYEYAKSIIEQQQARIVELEQDNDVQHNLIMRQSEILTKTANALKGEPEELSLHSHHDLMDVAHKLVRERDALVATVERLREQLSAMATQHQCGCGHPACNRCRDDADNQEVLCRANTKYPSDKDGE